MVDVLGHDPHELQWPVLKDQRRLILIAGGERGGKSWVSGEFGTLRTPYGDRFWIVGPDYELARPEFNYWIQNLLALGAIRSDRDISAPKIGKAQAITKTGQIIETKTSDDVHKLAAVAPNGIIMAEAAQQPYDAFLRCIGRVAETRGWLLLSGTFESSQDWYAEKFGEWQDPNNSEGGVSYSVPTWANRHIYPGGREDPEILRLEKLYAPIEGMFEERLGARPVPPVWLVFREFRYSIHVGPEARYDSNLPVYLAIDPSAGGNPYAVVACQFRRHERTDDHPDPIDYCYVIDEIYSQGSICEEIIEDAQTREWWPSVRGGAIDVEAPDDKKRWLKFGKVNLHAEKVPQVEGIRRMKTFLYYKRDPQTGIITEPPHLRINPKVAGLTYEFTKYQRKPPSDDLHAVKPEPPKDQHNHSVKARWYLLIARYGAVKRQKKYGVQYNYQKKATI
jgi:hypothetical protein